MSRPLPAPDAIARLETLTGELAALEADLERWLTATTDAAHERERGRRAALQLRQQTSRITAVLAPAVPGAATPPPWHGQERRSPQRATNVARLPGRSPVPCPDAPQDPQDWEPF